MFVGRDPPFTVCTAEATIISFLFSCPLTVFVELFLLPFKRAAFITLHKDLATQKPA